MPGSSRDPDGDDQASLAASLADHLKARAELLAIEAREASQVAAQKGIFGVLIVVLLFFSYTLVLTGAVSLLGGWLEAIWPRACKGIGWQLTALAAGALHFLLALILFSKLKRKPEQALFEYTRAEFQKDRAWLNRSKTSASENESSR
jgi:uncharacterized membrane protein YqjE